MLCWWSSWLPIVNDVLNKKLDNYYAKRRDYEAKKKVSNDAHKAWRAAEAEVVDEMLSQKVKSLERDDGTKPGLVKAVALSVVQANAEAIREWIVEQVGDDKDYVDTVVSKSAVGELVKKLIEKDKWDESDFPAVLSVSTRPTLRVTGWKALEGAEDPSEE